MENRNLLIYLFLYLQVFGILIELVKVIEDRQFFVDKFKEIGEKIVLSVVVEIVSQKVYFEDES